MAVFGCYVGWGEGGLREGGERVRWKWERIDWCVVHMDVYVGKCRFMCAYICLYVRTRVCICVYVFRSIDI